LILSTPDLKKVGHNICNPYATLFKIVLSCGMHQEPT
jgi:hypothetical protein